MTYVIIVASIVRIVLVSYRLLSNIIHYTYGW